MRTAWIFGALMVSAVGLSQGTASLPPNMPFVNGLTVKTEHRVTTRSGVVSYIAEAGHLPIVNAGTGETEAYMFHVNYFRKDVDTKNRPVIFAFNGGPGSATMWLHMGALGPKMANISDDGALAKPPYRPLDNPDTWLEFADIVCIDAIGTGYSRTAKVGERKFFGMQADIDAFAEFIRVWIGKNKRWGSPLFLCGESYGGIRAGGLCDALLDNGIALNGVIVVSGVMNYQTLSFSKGNDLPYIVYLPTYTATAWYHKKLSKRLQGNLESTIQEVKKWIDTEYAPALHMGDALPADRRSKIAKKLSEYTGLSESYVLKSNLRIRDFYFYKELLREEGYTVGRLDSRIKGSDALGVTASPEFDASSEAITPGYYATLHQHLEALGFPTDKKYYIFGPVGPWDYGQGRSFPDTSEPFRSCLTRNPFMKVLFTYGYYDVACPFAAMEYTVQHMDLKPSLQKNLEWAYYPAGHMMYIEKDSRIKLRNDVASFIERTMLN